MRKLATNLLLAAACIAVLLVATELVLRARYVPQSRTLAPNTHSRTTTSEYDVAIETDASGFRDANTPLTNKPGIAVIGDSFVFGSGVAGRDVFTCRLQDLLVRDRKPTEVWNFGVPGSGPFNALYLWRDYVRPRGPSLVMVVLYAGNDAIDALREARESRPRFVTLARAKVFANRARAWWRRRHPQPVTTLVPPAGSGWNAFGIDNPVTMEALLKGARDRHVPEDSVRARLAAIPDSLIEDARAFRTNPFNLLEAVLDPDGMRHSLLLDTAQTQEGWTLLESALRDLHRDVDQSGARFVLVCIPAAVQVDSTYWWLKHLGVRLDDRVLRQTEFQTRLAAFCVSDQIPMIDLLPAMRAHPDARLYYDQDGHWTAAGHNLAARAIEEGLMVIIRTLQWSQ